MTDTLAVSQVVSHLPCSLARNWMGRQMEMPGRDDRILEILNMGDHTHNTTSTVPFTQPLFRANPAEVCAQPLCAHQIINQLSDDADYFRELRAAEALPGNTYIPEQ